VRGGEKEEWRLCRRRWKNASKEGKIEFELCDFNPCDCMGVGEHNCHIHREVIIVIIIIICMD
jgi:hypothetical protein